MVYCNMSCIVGQSKRENNVEIEPMGCRPVSSDSCKSGFMAPSESITKPKDSLDQCCKCKPGKPCAYCIDPSKCTEEEQEQYMAEEDDECFSEDTGLYEPTPPEEPMEEYVPETVEDEMNTNNLVYLVGGGVCLFLVILLSLTR
tara:strand:+ start:281 stop:712 length:432 start_codon:yes stop_codon:yes gene_type:complete